MLKRALHWLGTGLALIGIVFVGLRLHEYWGSGPLRQIEPTVAIMMAGLALLYGASNVLLAMAWRQLLGQCGVPVTRTWSIRVYGVSQLARYIPGNIFHLAGRQALGMAAGVAAGALAKSTAWELGLIILAGTLFGWLALPLLVPGMPTSLGVIGMTGAIWSVGYVLRRFFGVPVAASFVWQALFLAVSAGVFVVLLDLVVSGAGLRPQTWSVVAGAYSAAWLAGIVTPGAPAGVGVREMTLLLLLKGLVTDAELLAAVLLSRLVTVAGDVLFYLTSVLIPQGTSYRSDVPNLRKY